MHPTAFALLERIGDRERQVPIRAEAFKARSNNWHRKTTRRQDSNGWDGGRVTKCTKNGRFTPSATQRGRRSRVIVLYFPFRQTSPYFTSLRTKDGDAILNLEYGNASIQWGRLIFHVSDVDRFWAYPMEKGFYPDSPRDASWGERYFHMPDPDGHELSFARPF